MQKRGQGPRAQGQMIQKGTKEESKPRIYSGDLAAGSLALWGRQGETSGAWVLVLAERAAVPGPEDGSHCAALAPPCSVVGAVSTGASVLTWD